MQQCTFSEATYYRAQAGLHYSKLIKGVCLSQKQMVTKASPFKTKQDRRKQSKRILDLLEILGFSFMKHPRNYCS